MSDIASVHASFIPTICSPYVTSVNPPVHALPILSILPYDEEHQEFPDGFPGTNYGEKNPSEIMVKFPHDITLTLRKAKFLEETPDTTKRVKYLGNFFLTRIKAKLTVINLRNYMLGVFHITSCTMRCEHGSINNDAIYIKTQVFRLLRYYSPAPRNIARSDWATQNITHNMTSSIT